VANLYFWYEREAYQQLFGMNAALANEEISGRQWTVEKKVS
jgi:hypothetical protein